MHFTQHQLTDALAEVADTQELVVDLSSVVCFDTTSLATLRHALDHQTVTILCSSPVLTQVLRDVGLERYLPTTMSPPPSP